MVGKCCQSRWRGDYLRYVGWSVKCFSPCILDIYFWDYTKHSIENNLLVNRHENSLYPRDVRACRLEARVSVDFPEPGAWEVSPQAAAVTWKRNLPPPSCSWSQFAQGRYRLCSSQSLDIACFHRETNIKCTEAVYTVQEGQSWGNYSYPTGVQTLSHSQLNP